MGKHKNKQTRGGRTHVKNKQYKKSRLVCNREKDLDQIQDEMKTLDTSNLPVDEELPGLGQYYCLTCARYFTTAEVLKQHKMTKVHKRKLKLALEKPYGWHGILQVGCC